MRTPCRVALFVAIVAGAAASLHAQTRSEQELVDLVVRDGPQARAIHAASDVVGLEQAARFVFPNPSASYTREGAGVTAFFQIDQSLPAFGLRRALERAGVAAREAAEAERDARLWQLRADAHDAVTRLRAAAERVQTAESLVRTVETLLEVLRTREREGEGSRFDRLRAEQELVDARQTLVTAVIDRIGARSALAALLPAGTALPDVVSAAPPAGSVDAIESLVARATASRAELRALLRAAQRFTEESDVARRASGPAPTFTGGLKRADDSGPTRTGAVIGASLVLPLFNRGAREAARWNGERLRADAERTALEADIRAAITRAVDTFALRGQSSIAVVAALLSAEELISIADVAYREGDIGVLPLLDAYRTAARARERVVEANMNLRFAQIALERAVGVTLWP
jgi:cobalt-zinc-cadmium efflux system outer membrane protein